MSCSTYRIVSIRDHPSVLSFRPTWQARPGPPGNRMCTITFSTLKLLKHLISFIKDLLNRDNFGYVELQHILNSILESHNAARAGSARALPFESWQKNFWLKCELPASWAWQHHHQNPCKQCPLHLPALSAGSGCPKAPWGIVIVALCVEDAMTFVWNYLDHLYGVIIVVIDFSVPRDFSALMNHW